MNSDSLILMLMPIIRLFQEMPMNRRPFAKLRDLEEKININSQEKIVQAMKNQTKKYTGKSK